VDIQHIEAFFMVLIAMTFTFHEAIQGIGGGGIIAAVGAVRDSEQLKVEMNIYL
jgi:hypothetical protein